MRQNSSAMRRFTRLSTRLYNVALALKYSHQNELQTALERVPGAALKIDAEDRS
jgi:hypothetical protein